MENSSLSLLREVCWRSDRDHSSPPPVERSFHGTQARQRNQSQTADHLLKLDAAEGYALWLGAADESLVTAVAARSPFVELRIVDEDAERVGQTAATVRRSRLAEPRDSSADTVRRIVAATVSGEHAVCRQGNDSRSARRRGAITTNL